MQDLQEVNRAVVPRASTVPDPHTLWNDLSPKKKCSSVVDISNALFSVPVYPDSQFWFAFTYRMKRYTYTRLPQGYFESPTIFSQAMSANLVKFNPPNDSQILLYVDGILLASPTEQDCKAATLAFLRFLAEQGHNHHHWLEQRWQWWIQDCPYFTDGQMQNRIPGQNEHDCNLHLQTKSRGVNW